VCVCVCVCVCDDIQKKMPLPHIPTMVVAPCCTGPIPNSRSPDDHTRNNLSRAKKANGSNIWPEIVFRVALASFRCLLNFYSDRKQTRNQFDTFVYISLPVSLAFLSVMAGDILEYKLFRRSEGASCYNRNVFALLNGCEFWQMISICHLDESRPFSHLLACICLVIFMASIPESIRSKWLSAVFVLVCVCSDAVHFHKRLSRIFVSMYALVAVSGAVTNSKMFKYLVHLFIISVSFYNYDCMLSGMILMVAVSRIGIAMAYDAESSGGLPVPCIP
jgi:hypothetical protein